MFKYIRMVVLNMCTSKSDAGVVLLLCVCVCMLMCVTMHIWRLEDNLLELVSFYHVGPMAQTQKVRLCAFTC